MVTQDYIGISCGPSNGVDDYIDATYVGPCNAGSITNVRHSLRPSRANLAAQITFATAGAACPSGYLQNDVNINLGTGGTVINLCFTYNPEFGAPLSNLTYTSGMRC